jgi:ATP/maltotriose-dependent transcriptional regulator MalT/DNA-binding SARP family transcriptional activator
MSLSEMVIKSKLIPPQPQRDVYHRARLQEKYKASCSYPLTFIHAGTGFGKTTALLELSSNYKQVFWYDITEPDRDPALFLAHLISAFSPSSDQLLERLQTGGMVAAPAIMTALINQLTLDLEDDVVLVLDDYHLVSDVVDITRWVEQLIENHPPRLHLAIASRTIPESTAFVRWRVKGTLLLIDQSDLAFTEDEIKLLFTDHFGFAITHDQAQSLFAYTDGWIIALQLIWQRLQSSPTRQLERILADLPTSFTEVFYFLAQEVLLRQPKGMQKFLLSSAVLRQLDVKACNELLGITNSGEILQQLVERGLFTFSVDQNTYRYQRLFQDFLLDQVRKDAGSLPVLHQKAAAYFEQNNNAEEAIFHLLAAGDAEKAADLIESTATHLLELGRLRTIAKWLEQLTESQMNKHPRLWLVSGEVYRLRANFDPALAAYTRAENVYRQRKDILGRSFALRSQAQVYLDTIRPLKASSLLEEAVSLLEPQEHPAEVAALLDQLAENKLNLGKPEEARALHNEAGMLRSEVDPDAIYLEARALLRTGRLQQAVNLFEPYQEQIKPSSTEQRAQKFHREMPLLLSLIHLMLGNVEKGELYARSGIEIGRQLDSPFVEAVGWMRLGHTCQLHPHLPWRTARLQQAKECYERSIELVRPFNVVRVQVEPLWGLCRYYGYQGRLVEAKRFADQAIEIADNAGDQWFVGLIQCTMGTAYALTGHADAPDWLQRSAEKLLEVGDVFSRSAALAARLYYEWFHGSRQEAVTSFASVASEYKSSDTGSILVRPTHIGMQDTQVFIPLLLEAYNQGIEPVWISQLLPMIDPTTTDHHPGYGLAVRTLGQFEVWRGSEQANPHEWQREKARQLFQFFISNQGKWFTREQLSDALWPNLDLDASSQNLKVALNALNRALEPARVPGQNPFFIIRQETLYGLNPAAQLQLDADDFLALASSKLDDDLETALQIYRGDYLPDATGENWTIEKREHLREIYLHTAHQLADKRLQDGQCDEAMRICHEILAVDPCNEPAYRVLMRCHAARGNLAAVHAVYQRCITLLNDELEVPPSTETTLLYEQLTQK